MEHFLRHRTNYLTGFLLIGLLIILFTMPISAYDVNVDGVSIGSIADQKLADALVQEIVDEMNASQSYEMQLKSSVSVKAVKVSRNEIMTEEALSDVLSDKLRFVTPGYNVVVDGEVLFTLGSQDDAETFLSQVKRQYITDGIQAKAISFVETVTIETTETTPDQIETYEQAWNRFVAGKQELLTYTVEEGDTTWALVQALNVELDELARVNPGVDLARLQIGQKIYLNRPEAFINVQSVVAETVEETIQSDITYEKTDRLFVGEKELKSEGANGKKRVEIESTYVNGILEKEDVISEKIIEEPVDTVLLTGTKWREVVAVGEFVNPVNGVFTSRFGQRWGRMHSGIDIGAPKGTPIKAAADGIVVHVGNINGYGMTVKVDHGNGVQTLYGHASGYNVELGQVVSKNDVIAYVGKTGHTTGYCLHFEVRVNGTPVDPIEYVNY